MCGMLPSPAPSTTKGMKVILNSLAVSSIDLKADAHLCKLRDIAGNFLDSFFLDYHARFMPVFTLLCSADPIFCRKLSYFMLINARCFW